MNVISVGAFTVNMIEDRLNAGQFVLAVDPNPYVWTQYEALYNRLDEEKRKLFSYDKSAVTTRDGDAVELLVVKKLRDDGVFDVAASTTTGKGVFGGYTVIDKISCEAISLEGLIDTVGSVDELHINCEGEEVPLLLETPMNALMKCKEIRVEFHGFIPFLGIGRDDVDCCISRLAGNFEILAHGPDNWNFIFRRKF